MNLERFADLIAAYGTDPRRWPAAERRAAETLLAASAAAQQLVRDAAEFDGLLAAMPLPVIEPSIDLHNRIMAQAMAQPKPPGWRSQIAEAFGLLFPAGRMMPQLAALTLALAIGVGAGFANILPVDTQDSSDLVTLQLSSAVPVYLEE
jgi:hypothetical protein